jgi:hypothetical protein
MIQGHTQDLCLCYLFLEEENGWMIWAGNGLAKIGM